MLMQNIPIDVMKGQTIVYAGRMNSRKTFFAIAQALSIDYSRYGILAFTNNVNTRDPKDKIKSTGLIEFPAICIDVKHPEQMLEEVAKKRAQGERVDVGIISEANFYDYRLIPVINALTDVKQPDPLMLIIEGLDRTFRGDIFGPMGRVLEMTNYPIKLSANCVVEVEGAQCSKPDSENARILRIAEHGFDPEFDVRVVFYRGKDRVTDWRFAHYFDQTVRPEPTNKDDADWGYANCCANCFEIPGKNLTDRVMELLQSERGNASKEHILSTFDHHLERRYIAAVMEFLVNERRVVFDGGVFEPTHYVKDPASEMFIPAYSDAFPKTNPGEAQQYSFEKNKLIWVPKED